MVVHATLHTKNIYMMKRGERTAKDCPQRDQQLQSQRFHNITLLYPNNGIKFNTTGKTRNSDDFINHLRNIKRYVIKRGIKRFILVIDNASFHVSKKDQTGCGKTI